MTKGPLEKCLDLVEMLEENAPDVQHMVSVEHRNRREAEAIVDGWEAACELARAQIKDWSDR